MVTAGFEKALVAKKEFADGVLDEEARTVLTVNVDSQVNKRVRKKIWALKGEIETHFGVQISGGHGPVFLRYEVGAFYKPHKDTSADARPDIVPRKVSIVIFLNSFSKEPVENCFGGGALTFYGLLKEPEWEKCAFPLEAEAGLLIAFPSDMLHEVQPVTFGRRFSIVAWLIS